MEKRLFLIALIFFLSSCNRDEDLLESSSLLITESASVSEAESEPLSGFTTTSEQEKIPESSSSIVASQTIENINQEIMGLDFEALNSKEAIFGRWSNYSLTFDNFSYAIEYDGVTYTTEADAGLFDENFRCIEKECDKGDKLYKKFFLGDQIGNAKVTDCSYTCEVFDSRGEIHTEPYRATLTFSGEITLKGVIAYAEEGDDYWNVYSDIVLFFPYAESLKESCMPLLHTEKIDTVYYRKGMPAFGFYGETLPFELGYSADVLYNGKTLGEFLGGKKFQEATIQFEEIEQSWMYMNGSGWNPCKTKIIKIMIDSD